jgi:hypothetical protein
MHVGSLQEPLDVDGVVRLVRLDQDHGRELVRKLLLEVVVDPVVVCVREDGRRPGGSARPERGRADGGGALFHHWLCPRRYDNPRSRVNTGTPARAPGLREATSGCCR